MRTPRQQQRSHGWRPRRLPRRFHITQRLENEVMFARIAVVVSVFAALAGPALAQSGGDRFCKEYASTVARIAGDAIRRNPACQDYSKGVHANFQMHYSWCMRTPRPVVEGAANNIRRLAGLCTRGPGSFQHANCQQYGAWAVAVILQAQRQGCNVRRSGEVLDPRFHENWCRHQTPAMMARARDIHRTGVAHRCAQQGVRVRL